jgi:hypothetical protein
VQVHRALGGKALHGGDQCLGRCMRVCVCVCVCVCVWWWWWGGPCTDPPSRGAPQNAWTQFSGLKGGRPAPNRPPPPPPPGAPTCLPLQRDGHAVGHLVAHAKLTQAEDGGQVGSKEARSQHNRLVSVQVPVE